MFHIPPNNSSATISLPAASTVRPMLFSSREILSSRIVGLTISVGDSYATSTCCFKSSTGLSTWITCNAGLGAVGSYIYMANTTGGFMEFYELMAF